MTTTPVVNRTELRQVMGSTPPATRNALMDTYKAAGWRPLSEDGWTTEELFSVADSLRRTAEATGHDLRIPLDTSSLRDRIMALPDDLADWAAAEAAAAPGGGVPNVGHANRWTVAHWQLADGVIGQAEEMAATRLRFVHAALGSVPLAGDGPDEADRQRHMVVGCITDGRTESSRKLTGPEAAHLGRWAEGVATGVLSGPPSAYVPDWKAEAKRLGVTQAELLKSAKEWAKAHRLDPPRAISDVTGHRMIAGIIGTSLDGRTVMSDVAEVAAAVTPELTEEQTQALFDEANGLPVAEPAPTVSAQIHAAADKMAERGKGATPPPADELDGALRALAPVIVRHRAAREEYQAAYAALVAALDAVGVTGIAVARPLPADELVPA